MAKTHGPMTWTDYVRLVIGDDPQVAASRRTGIDQATISRWLSDPTHIPSASAACDFARGYGHSVPQALVAAGYLTHSEVHQPDPRVTDLSSVSDNALVAELRRRLREARH